MCSHTLRRHFVTLLEPWVWRGYNGADRPQYHVPRTLDRRAAGSGQPPAVPDRPAPEVGVRIQRFTQGVPMQTGLLAKSSLLALMAATLAGSGGVGAQQSTAQPTEWTGLGR